MQSFRSILRLLLRRVPFGDEASPVAATPNDRAAGAQANWRLQRAGTDWRVTPGNADVPACVTLRPTARTGGAMQAPRGANWQERPAMEFRQAMKSVQLNASGIAEGAQRPLQAVLALTRGARPCDARSPSVSTPAQASHRAWPLPGGNSDEALVEDTDGQMQFDHIVPCSLPDGPTRHVLRSPQTSASPARPPQRSGLMSPGPLGPETQIPMRPAPGPGRVSVARPESSRTVLHSDTVVTHA